MPKFIIQERTYPLDKKVDGVWECLCWITCRWYERENESELLNQLTKILEEDDATQNQERSTQNAQSMDE